MRMCTGFDPRWTAWLRSDKAEMAPVLEQCLLTYARHFPIRRGKMRVINSLWHLAAARDSTERVAVLKHGAFQMPCDLSEMLQRQFFYFGTYFMEEDILGCWVSAAKGAKVVLDVGANAGIYSLAALAVEPTATVHAFEPTPEIAARLRATARMNGLDHLHVHEAAVLSDGGLATLNRCRGDLGTNEGMNFITVDTGDSVAERVKSLRLDDFCREHAIEHVDLLKLDVQGQEYSALSGAKRMIDQGRVEMIFAELNWTENGKLTCPASESIRLLQEAGYEFSRPGKRLNWKQAGHWLQSLGDVVARRTQA